MSIERARTLRQNMTAPEAKLWNALRELKPLGHRFPRQVEFGGRYYVDFCCHASCLVVEVDGESHFVGSAPSKDQARDAFLAAQGYRLLRVTNVDVMGNIEGVVGRVMEMLALGDHPTQLR